MEDFESGDNTAFYDLEERVCKTLEQGDPVKLLRLANRIRRYGSASLVRELAEMLGLEEGK